MEKTTPKTDTENPLIIKGLAILLIACTLIVYGQVLSFDFVEYDDDYYILNNPDIQQAIGLKSLKWAFTATYQSTWQPLVWISYLIDYQVGGLHPGTFHFTNLLFHIFNVLLLFSLLKMTTKKVWTSAVISFLFACHPLHVESVAWISERKDVLSTFFFLAALRNHCIYGRGPTILRYAGTFLLFAAGLMSKPMVVTLPFVLLLMDYWPLKRIRFEKTENESAYKRVLVLVVEKIPLFALTIFFSIMTYRIQETTGAVSSFSMIGFADRVANALTSYGWYLVKTIWPVDLSVIYLHKGKVPLMPALMSGIVLAGITFAALGKYRQRPWRAVGWLWYLGTLIPVIGIIQFGKHSHADRFTYIPLMGIYLMVCHEISFILEKRRKTLVIIVPFAIILAGALMFRAHRQAALWESGITLFSHVLSMDPTNTTAHRNMAAALIRKGKIREGTAHIERVLEIKPGDVGLHLKLARTYLYLGDPEKAVEHYKRAAALDPGNQEAEARLLEFDAHRK